MSDTHILKKPGEALKLGPVISLGRTNLPTSLLLDGQFEDFEGGQSIGYLCKGIKAVELGIRINEVDEILMSVDRIYWKQSLEVGEYNVNNVSCRI